MRNGLYWKDLFRGSFTEELKAYALVLSSRVLPAFANLEAESQGMERVLLEHHRRSSNQSDEYSDYDDAAAAESAFDEALSHFLRMSALKKGITNLWGAGLYHLLEQQMLVFVRHELLPDGKEATRDAALDQLKKLLAASGVTVEKFESWPKLEELRLFANCAKHAEVKRGDCERLRNRRPDLFVNPDLPSDPEPFVESQASNPLMGEGLYLTEGSFDDFAFAVKQFLKELGDAVAEGESYEE